MNTSDRGYFAPIEAGKTRRLTPEGFLICEDVGIARTGEQVYSAADLPGLKPDSTGRIYVTRSPAEVFAAETIASFEGKPVTIFHPNEFVGPENWKSLSVGHLQNVRRGEGADADLLKGDIVITDAAAIQYAMQSLPDISCGYDAKYSQEQPGRATQYDIRGNHAALVPTGRAGERCAVRDHSQPLEETMKSRTRDLLSGNDPQQLYSTGSAIWDAGSSLEPLRQSFNLTLAPLDADKNYTEGKPVPAEDIAQWAGFLGLLKDSAKRVEDALGRTLARDQHFQEPADPAEKTKDSGPKQPSAMLTRARQQQMNAYAVMARGRDAVIAPQTTAPGLRPGQAALVSSARNHQIWTDRAAARAAMTKAQE
jgi:uncharacterized protein DUF2213